MGECGNRPNVSDEGRILTRAAIRAADRLDIPQRNLAAIIGVSESVVSRMRRGSFALVRDKGKGFELAALFVRLAMALDLVLEGNVGAARTWLLSENSALQGKPLDLIQSIHGLVSVVRYLEAHSEVSL